MGEVIQAAHLFQREPTPSEERSAFWQWGSEYVDDGVNNLLSIVDDIKDAPNEEAFRRGIEELKAEVSSFPDFD